MLKTCAICAKAKHKYDYESDLDPVCGYCLGRAATEERREYERLWHKNRRDKIRAAVLYKARNKNASHLEPQ